MASISERENREIEAANASGNTPVVLIHGLWLLPSSWAAWADCFAEAGYAPLTPDWPDDPETVEEARRDPTVLAGKLTGRGKLHVDLNDGKAVDLEAKHIIVATGARARELPFAQSDGKRIWTYRHAMVPNEMPTERSAPMPLPRFGALPSLSTTAIAPSTDRSPTNATLLGSCR